MGADLTTLGYALGENAGNMKTSWMSCLMLLPVVLLVFGLVGSLVVLWRNTGSGVNDGYLPARPAPFSYAVIALMMFSALMLLAALQHPGIDAGYRPVSGEPACRMVFHLASSHGIRL